MITNGGILMAIWGFPKMLVPNNHWFSYHHLRKHPYSIHIVIYVPLDPKTMKLKVLHPQLYIYIYMGYNFQKWRKRRFPWYILVAKGSYGFRGNRRWDCCGTRFSEVCRAPWRFGVDHRISTHHPSYWRWRDGDGFGWQGKNFEKS